MDTEREKMERGKSELRMAMEELCLAGSRDGEDQKHEQKQQQRSSTMDLIIVSKQLLHVLGWSPAQYPIRCRIMCCLFLLVCIRNECSRRLSRSFDRKIKPF